jgi:aminoglycoside 6'-N-acetyltransferase
VEETESSFRFRAIARQDFGLLNRWMGAPHVHRWWREPFDLASIEDRYGPSIDGRDPTECFVVEYEGGPIGFIQRYRLADNPDWQRSLLVAGTPNDGAGIDYFIGSPSRLGKGLGPRIIDQFVEELWVRYPEIMAVVVDVSVENRRSWRALEKAGFRQVWSGTIESDDPSDDGPCHIYLRCRDEGREPGGDDRGQSEPGGHSGRGTSNPTGVPQRLRDET